MLPKLKLSCLLVCALALLMLLPSLYAQQPGAMFQVIHLPRKAGYSKQKLNAELAVLKNKDAVKKLLKSKNFPPQTSIVIYINRPANGSAYWTINTSSPTDREDSQIILQSRGGTATKFYTLGEFKDFFKDSLALIDTLQLELFIRDDAYPDNRYVLSSFCGKTAEKKKIPFEEGKLIFTPALLSDCKDAIPSVSIYNENNSQRILASCRLAFLTAEQKETLLSMAGFIKDGDPAKDIKEIALQLWGYSLHRYGKLLYPQLLNWLQNNGATGHGDNQ